MSDTVVGLASKRITTVLPSLLPLGGAERLALNLIKEMLLAGYSADLVLFNDSGEVRAAVPAGCRVINLGAARLVAGLVPLVRYLRSVRPDVVHVMMWPLTSYAVLARAIARVETRLVVSDHSMLSRQYASRGVLHSGVQRAIMRLTYRFADVRVAVSGDVAADVARMSGLPEETFRVVHNAIDAKGGPELPPSEADRLWRGRPGARILTVGRLKRVKNHDLLLRAFSATRSRIEGTLAIVGGGELYAETANLVRAYGLEGSVIMPGQVDDPSNYYSSANVFVLTSDYEGFGNVLVEAMAFGLPIVSTNCAGGPREILAHGSFGRLVPVNSADALADAIVATVEQPHDPERQRARAASFETTVVAKQYLSLFFPDL